MPAETYNVAQTLGEMATQNPNQAGLYLPCGHDPRGRTRYIVYSFAQLSGECDRIASGLMKRGVREGQRVLLMIRPGIELLTATFGLIKCGAVPILIDPGMGIKSLLQCIKEAEPQVFIGIAPALWLSVAFPGAFRSVGLRVTVGSGFPFGTSFDELRQMGDAACAPAPTTMESEAAITFTSGSTGIPKGVIYRHGNFRAVIDVLREDIGISAGEIDLPGLYILALLNPALGVTTVIRRWIPPGRRGSTRPTWSRPFRLLGLRPVLGRPRSGRK